MAAFQKGWSNLSEAENVTVVKAKDMAFRWK